MSQIREWLFIGNYAQTIDLQVLNRDGITAILQLAEKVTHPNIETLYLKMDDGESISHDSIAQGIAFMRAQKVKGGRLMVACGAGISRSTTFAMAILMEEEQLPLFDAYAEIYRQYFRAEPHPQLIMSLSAYYGKELTLIEAYEALEKVRASIDDTH